MTEYTEKTLLLNRLKFQFKMWKGFWVSVKITEVLKQNQMMNFSKVNLNFIKNI